MTAAASRPLTGTRILDLSTMIFGPLAAQSLGDLGAEVIKIEAPEGDLTRYIGPRRSPAMGAFYLNSNRNKRSLVLDLKRAEGREVLEKLVESADVLLHSTRPDAARRLGLGYEALSARNRRLIVCHCEGFAAGGVDAGKPAYDDVIQATSGLAMLQSVVAGEPRFVPAVIADKISALHAAYAVLAALLHRNLTGRGEDVRVPMLELMAGFNTVEHLWGANFIPPLGGMGYVPVSQAARRPFRTLDGYLAVLPYTDLHWRGFCEATGDSELASDPRYATHVARQHDQPGFWAEVGRQVAKRRTADWIERLEAAGVPYGRVNGLDDLLDDPQLRSSGFWQTMEHPSEGTLRHPGAAISFSDAAPCAPRHAPLLGEHSAEILAELGLSETRIRELEGLGVTRPQPRS